MRGEFSESQGGRERRKEVPIPRHGQAPLACIVIDLQRCRHAHAAHCPPPTAQPPTTPLHRTHNAWEPHWNQHLISTLNQPDNFKQRTREEAIYAHCTVPLPCRGAVRWSSAPIFTKRYRYRDRTFPPPVRPPRLQTSNHLWSDSTSTSPATVQVTVAIFPVDSYSDEPGLQPRMRHTVRIFLIPLSRHPPSLPLSQQPCPSPKSQQPQASNIEQVLMPATASSREQPPRVGAWPSAATHSTTRTAWTHACVCSRFVCCSSCLLLLPSGCCDGPCTSIWRCDNVRPS